ncbi:MAG: type III-B CRISPR-associated protein Cas10/Cmr2 [Deltaproteobacteria bacterium]|nr:type III-B CRISPR-associated protein Cas10/Cmr2 [Deltaproteobacteria bacterium]
MSHPLSGTEHTFDKLPEDLNAAELEQLVIDEIAQIKAEAGKDDDLKRTYLLLWRSLPDRLKEKRSDIPWEHLPADSRIPSHTVWEHASVASAVAGAWPEPAILLFTIASAHDFISTARRTQDAWMGSFLLSYLTWAAIQVIAEACGPDAVLSPALRGQPLVDRWLAGKGVNLPAPSPDQLSVANLPNIFTALVPAGAVRELAKDAAAAVEGVWKEVYEGVQVEVEERLGFDPGWREVWDRQASRLPRRLGIFWATSRWRGARPEDVAEAFVGASGHDGSGASAELRVLIQRVRTQLGDAAAVTGLAYPCLSAFAGRALSARKNVRDFEQVEEPGEKCSLCGQLSALHPEGKGSYDEVKAFWSDLSQLGRNEEEKDGLKLAGRLRRGERLCAVCLTKRLALDAVFQHEPGRAAPARAKRAADHYFGLNRHIFPSTASVATAPFLRAVLERPGLREALARFGSSAHSFLKRNGLLYPANLPRAVVEFAEDVMSKEDAKKLCKVDGAWLFPSAYDPASIERETGVRLAAGATGLEETRKALQDLREAARKAEIPAPSPYFAVLALDGDRMGEWLTGKRAPKWTELFCGEAAAEAPSWVGSQDRPMGAAMHLALSSSLGSFSLELARPAVEAHGGSLIFAGGDDVLALLPAVGIFGAVRALQERFSGEGDGWWELKEKKQFLRVLGGREGMTASIGVAVVHHSHVLSHAIDWAHRLLEDDAKDRLGRNAFCIGVARRSGEETTAGFSFASSAGRSALAPLQEILSFMEKGELSPRLAYRVARATWADGDLARRNDLGRPSAFETELLRLARQHAVEARRDDAAEAVQDLYEAVSDGPPRPKGAKAESTGPDVYRTVKGLLLTAAFAVRRGE